MDIERRRKNHAEFVYDVHLAWNLQEQRDIEDLLCVKKKNDGRAVKVL